MQLISVIISQALHYALQIANKPSCVLTAQQVRLDGQPDLSNIAFNCGSTPVPFETPLFKVLQYNYHSILLSNLRQHGSTRTVNTLQV
jgi:hypothetical protein